MKNISDFQDLIGYQFKNLSLLDEALTHPSVNRSGDRSCNYQRLEFFGDKVLGLIVSEYLMENFPQESEGDLSKRYSYIVSCDNLFKVALEIEIDKIIKLSYGEKNSGGALKKSNLENCLEALIGAIYFDSGIEEARKFVLNVFAASLDEFAEPPTDPVSRLQEIVQEKTKTLPEVNIARVDGSDHDPIFEAHIVVEDLGVDVVVRGSSKKEANKNACIEALKVLES